MERVNLSSKGVGLVLPLPNNQNKGPYMPEEEVTLTDLKEEQIELEKKIELLELSRINLRVSPVTYDRLYRQAEFSNITIEEHCVNILAQYLQQQIGKATINCPSTLSGKEVVKITGPSGGIVSRG